MANDFHDGGGRPLRNVGSGKRKGGRADVDTDADRFLSDRISGFRFSRITRYLLYEREPDRVLFFLVQDRTRLGSRTNSQKSASASARPLILVLVPWVRRGLICGVYGYVIFSSRSGISRVEVGLGGEDGKGNGERGVRCLGGGNWRR
jgi:hypothetical protein